MQQHKNMKNISILVISIANPILIGLYENNQLKHTISKDGKTSDILPEIFNKLLNQYSINNIFYVNGPGSYMAIKVAYIFLKTISITNNIILKASSGFHFNNNSPIKALGKKYFFNTNNGKIIVDFLSKKEEIKDFFLPQILDENIFIEDSLPDYHLPAVS